MDLIFYILAFLVAISLLVAIHEYGHYIVARWCGIKVLRFSVGFGRPIWLRRAGPDKTEYCISALPLGGYVRMLDEREGAIEPEDRGRTFQAQPIWQRIAVLFAGPLANFLFVIVAFWFLFMVGIPTQKAVVGQVIADSPAAAAGLAEGDTIEAVAGKSVAGFEQAFIAIIEDMVGDGEVTLTVSRPGESSTSQIVLSVDESLARLEEPGQLLGGLGFSGWRDPAVLGQVLEDGAAAAAGLKVGDRIVAIDGSPIRAFQDVVETLDLLTQPEELVVEVLRGSDRQTFTVTPKLMDVDDEQRLIMGIGVDLSQRETITGIVRLGPFAAIPAAVQRLFAETGFTVRMLGRMVTGDVSAKNLSGPVSIAQFAGEAAERGLSDYIRFLAVISISLGILNLLPIPMLDGGQIVYQTIEGITGAPVSERVQIIGQQFGIFVLLSVMVFAFYNDIARLFGS